MNKHDNYRQQPLGTSNADMGQWQTDTLPAQTVTKSQSRNKGMVEMLHSSSSSKIAETAIGSAEQLQIDGRSGLGDESERSDITLEKIVNDEHIRELAVRQMENIVSKVREGEAAAEGQYRYEDVVGEEVGMADALESLCSDEQGKQRLTDIINESGMSVQELGDSLETLEMDKVKDPDFQWDNERVSDIAKYNSVLKKLGWEPFKEEDSIEELFGTRPFEQSNDIQHRANQLGLITPEVTDRLYTYQYHKLLNKAKRGRVNRETFGYTVNSDLIPSGNNLTANYWHEQSRLIGGDAMQICMERISNDVRYLDLSDVSEFINEDGTMRDAFFRNCKGSLLQGAYSTCGNFFRYDRREMMILKLLEVHRDQVSEADGSKTMIDMLGKMKDEDGKYDIEAMRQLQWHIGRFCVESPDKLFDEGKPTDEFYSLAFKQSLYGEKYIDKFMSHIDSNWQDHYGDTGRKYLDLVTTYPDQPDVSEGRRTNWLKDYLDADGPTNELFDEIFLDGENIKIFREHPELQTKLTGDKKSFIKFCNKYGLSNQDMRKCGLAVDNLPEYFDANGPTSKMKGEILFKGVEILYEHPELQEGLSAEQKSMVKFCEECGLDNRGIAGCGITADNLPEYFDANGPVPEFLWGIFSGGNYNVIYKYYQSQGEAGIKRMGFDDKQMTAIDSCGNVGEDSGWNNPRKAFGDYVNDHYDELTIEQIRQVSGIIARLSNSNASELAERSEAFTRELLKLDTDKIPEALDKIEDIYIHNHLPYVGKNYLVFRTMHPSPNLEDDFNFSPLSYGRPNTISPVLQQATGDIRSGKLDQMLNSRDTIIVSDLLRASLGSNNRSIREYLATLKNGQSLLDQLSSGELDWSAFNQPTSLMDKDTKANYDTLSTFAWHLATIYNSTLPGKEHPYQLMHQQSGTDEPSAQPNALQADFANLTSLIKPNSRYSLADRSVRYFAHFVGIEDLAGAEQYMDNVVKEADARNRRMAEHLVTTKESKLQPGDLVKGMGGTVGDGIRYLSYAFQNGSISKEYLGDASRSDTTPLDADASIVPDQLNGQTINQIMNGWDRYMLANSYGGGLWVVLRPDNDRFIVTRRGKDEADQSVYDLSVPDANFDRTDLTQEEIDRRLKEIAEAKRHRREGLPKLEIFATGVDGDGHYGVRTGFGMNLVSFCVTDSTLRDSTPVSEVTKLEIALDGFYIPVVDRDSEELIFTPDDYDKMRAQMSGLSYYRTGDYQFAPDNELELGELTLDKESLSAVSAPTTSSTNSSSSSISDDAQGASSNPITIPSTTTIISELPAGMAETDHKHEVINQTIKQAITNIPELNLSYKDYLDGDLTENIVEMIDTGSTGRQTNAPGSGDFDYLARLDRSILNDPAKKQQITDALLAAFGRENDGSAIVNGNLRLKQVSIDGLAEPVDIDITFAQKTNKVQYPTDAALADRLSNIKNQSETKYQQVLANIIYAKQFLKAAGAYKPRRSPEAKGIGGLGGVGIENWVLQHGGSFKQAARDFLAVADNCSGFEDFCAHYPVWDYGENHKGIRSKPHDNFVADNMNQEGYDRMKQALRAVVG